MRKVRLIGRNGYWECIKAQNGVNLATFSIVRIKPYSKSWYPSNTRLKFSKININTIFLTEISPQKHSKKSHKTKRQIIFSHVLYKSTQYHPSDGNSSLSSNHPIKRWSRCRADRTMSCGGLQGCTLAMEYL